MNGCTVKFSFNANWKRQKVENGKYLKSCSSSFEISQELRMLSRLLSEGQSLILMSGLEFINLSGIVNCVTKSLREAIKINIF